MNQNINNLANNLKTLRKKNGLSQEQIAEKLFVSRQAVSKWELGETSPDTDALIRLAQLYGVSIDHLITGDHTTSNGDETIFQAANQQRLRQIKIKSTISLILAITLYIISPLTLLLSSAISYLTIAWIFGGIVVVATAIIIYYSTLEQERKELLQRSAKTSFADTFSAIISILAAMIFLFIGFIFRLWHPGWLVFLFVPIAWFIGDMFDSKHNKNSSK